MKCLVHKIRDKRAAAMIEYMMLIIIVLGGLYVFQTYISRAMNGRWKATGDSFGMGRQYQSNRTADCAYAQIDANHGVWVDSTCYQQAITLCKPGDFACEDAKKQECHTDYCDKE
jgi:hypothetical protein